MPSRVDRPRVELLLRCMALGALLWLTVEALSRRSAGSSVELTESPTGTVLAQWSTTPPADTLGVALRSAPTPLIRDWLVALRRTGLGVRWSDGGIPPVMIEAERRTDPAGVVSLRVTGPAGAAVLLSDDLGPLDSLTLGALGSSVRLAAVAGQIHAALQSGDRAVMATSTPPPIVNCRHLVLLGEARWESKFVAAALEERGWRVDSRLAVAPGIDVTQGRPFPLDTARHAAVIALDSTAAAYASAIVSFVRQGGGALLGPEGASTTTLRALAPGRGGVMVRPALSSGVPMSRELLRLHDLAPLAGDAIPLERRGGHVAVAVRRIGAGRVGQIGYPETWRWRMGGGTDGVAAHRGWWAAVVAAVAYGSEPEAGGAGGDPAPRAALFSALGDPVPPASHSPRTLFPYVLALLGFSLFGEWLSRRLRGAG